MPSVFSRGNGWAPRNCRKSRPAPGAENRGVCVCCGYFVKIQSLFVGLLLNATFGGWIGLKHRMQLICVVECYGDLQQPRTMTETLFLISIDIFSPIHSLDTFSSYVVPFVFCRSIVFYLAIQRISKAANWSLRRLDLRNIAAGFDRAQVGHAMNGYVISMLKHLFLGPSRPCLEGDMWNVGYEVWKNSDPGSNAW